MAPQFYFMNWKFEPEVDLVMEDEILFISGPVGLNLNTYLYALCNMNKIDSNRKKNGRILSTHLRNVIELNTVSFSSIDSRAYKSEKTTVQVHTGAGLGI